MTKSKEDLTAFEDSMHGVVAIDAPQRASTSPGSQIKREAWARRRANATGENESAAKSGMSDGGLVLVQPNDFVEWKLDGVQPKVFRTFQQGGYEIQKTLDLHKVGIERARVLVSNLIDRCIDLDYRCVRILHGRGENSNPPAALKSHVLHWLRQHKDVIALSTAPNQLGGTGAVLVKIRKGHKAKQDNRERYGR
ncbi:MAG: Smr/MutS family protein [Gammaproteobacteria bacterium]|nr:Smr/MutS family protein [Gammaproteobacteria bacterium]